MRRTTLPITAALALLLLSGCQIEGDSVAPSPTAPAPFCGDFEINQASEQCEPPGTESCDDQCQNLDPDPIVVALSCNPVPGAALTAECFVSSNYTGPEVRFDWGDGQSSGWSSQSSGSHVYAAAGTYLIRVEACSDSSRTNCGSDDAPVAVQ